MAYVLQSGDVVRVAIFCKMASQVSVNVRYWRAGPSVGSSATDQDFAEHLDAAIAPNYKPCLNNNAEYLGVKAQVISPFPKAIVETNANQGVGTGGASAMSTQTAGLVKLLTADAGRNGRGRIYIPFPSEEDNEPNGRPGAAYLAALDTVGNDFITTYTVDPTMADPTLLTPVLWSVSTLTHKFLTGKALRQDWATQRRRSQINKSDVNPF